MKNFYVLPELPYGFKDLEPILSEEQLKIHYEKHHNAYVKNANDLLEKLDKVHEEGREVDLRAWEKAFSFNVNGHLLHSLFWESMTPEKKSGEPGKKLGELIKDNFGGIEKFKKEFMQTAMTVEGSGWAALTQCPKTGRLLLMQIEKHNMNCYAGFKMLLVMDAFEHAYYIDYKNEKGKFFEAFWKIVNWEAAEKRLDNEY